MREDTELRRAMDLSRPYPPGRWVMLAMALVATVFVLCALGAWKAVELVS